MKKLTKSTNYVSNIIVYLTILSIVLFIPKDVQLNPLIPAGNYIYMIILLVVFMAIFSKNLFGFNNELLKLIIIILLLFLYSFTSSFWSDLQFESAWRSIIVFIPMLLFILIAYKDGNIENTTIKIYYIYFVLGNLLSIYGILIYILGDISVGKSGLVNSFGPFDQVIHVAGGNIYRISSFTGNPNVLGVILMVTLIITFYLFFSNQIKMFVFLISLALQLSGLYLAFSRTNIIVTLFVLILFVFISPKMQKANLKRALFKIVLLIAVIIGPIIYFTRISLGLSLTGRDVAWGLLYQRFLESPILGIGFNTSTEYLSTTSFEILNAHSFYMGMLVELGVLGMFLTVILMLYVYRILLKVLLSKRNRRIDSDTYLLVLTNGCIITGIFINQITEFALFRSPDYMNIVWLFLIVSTIKISENSFSKTN